MTPSLAFSQTPGQHAAVQKPRTPALIAAQGVSLDLGGRTVLDNIDLELCAGEIVTLIGPNGAGKTTLARVLLGLLKPSRGSVVRSEGLRIGYVPQRFAVDPAIPVTVSRFLTLGVRARPEAIAGVLVEVGAGHLADRALSALSGGEFQRVSLARALIAEPHFLMLDEPVQGVDYSGEAQLYGLIGQIRHVSFDVTQDILDSIGDGNTLATIDCQQFLQGYLGVVLMHAYLRHGVSACGEIMTGPRIVDLTTLPDARERLAAGLGCREDRT